LHHLSQWRVPVVVEYWLHSPMRFYFDVSLWPVGLSYCQRSCPLHQIFDQQIAQ
jgi:hypothetical protein